MIIGVAVKQPWEVLDWDIDCSPAFNGTPDTVASVSIEVTPDEVGGVTAQAVLMGTDQVKCWFYGGNENTEYTAEVFITTVAGRQKEDEIIVSIKEFE